MYEYEVDYWFKKDPDGDIAEISEAKGWEA